MTGYKSCAWVSLKKIGLFACTCVAVPTKKRFLPNLCSNRQLKPPLPLNFSYRIFRHSALPGSSELFHWSNISQGRHGLLGALPWVWRSDSSFRDLPSRRRRRKLKMWFQALEFAVSCTATKCIFYSGRKSRGARTRFSKIGSFTPPSKTGHRTPFSLPMPALTPGTRWPCYCSVFMYRTAEKQRSTFCTADAAELCMNYVYATNH